MRNVARFIKVWRTTQVIKTGPENYTSALIFHRFISAETYLNSKVKAIQ